MRHTPSGIWTHDHRSWAAAGLQFRPQSCRDWSTFLLGQLSTSLVKGTSRCYRSRRHKFHIPFIERCAVQTAQRTTYVCIWRVYGLSEAGMNSKRASTHLPAALCSVLRGRYFGHFKCIWVLRYGAEDGVGSPPADCATASTTNSTGQYCPK